MAGSLTGRTAHGIFDSIFALFAMKGVYQSDGAAANVTLDNTYPAIWKYDPTGAGRDITLDAESTANTGLLRIIINGADAAEDLTVKDADGNTIGTVSQNEFGIFYNSGSAWSLVFIVTGALS
jgi:hypothetical protein